MNVFTFIITLAAMTFGFITWWIKLGIDPTGGGKRRRRRRRHERDGDNHDLERLSAMADSLTERIDVLESILDAEVPNWREHHEQAG
ncbi:MAG: hypothetical protein OXH27_05870 [Gammaproteobacteria bacterium]|nr:hypothetical protein [Gammaproteobacteria bacterium]